MTATDTIDGVVGSFLEDQKDHSYDRQDNWTHNMRKNRSATGDDFGSQYTRCNDQDYSDNLSHLVLSLYASLLGSRHADRFSTHEQRLPRCSPPLKERLEVVNSTSVQLYTKSTKSKLLLASTKAMMIKPTSSGKDTSHDPRWRSERLRDRTV